MIWLRIPFQTSLLLMVFALAKVQEKPTHHIADHLSYEMQPRIIGGDETSPKRYPFMVSLRINGEHFCGGTLIAPDVILTAAHCTIIDFNAVTAVIGSHTIDGQTTMGENIEKISVQRVYSHPDYSSITNNYDMALVFLKESATSNVNYARLNSDIKIPTKEDTLTALGWGDTTAEDGYDFSNVLLEVNVDYMENDECDASKDSNNDSYEGMIKDTMLCASSPGKDGCQGDSGGPIIIKGSNPSEDIQVGISSWGYGCASPDFPGVYARISSSYKWIRNRVCRRSKDPPEWFNCWEKKRMADRFAFKKNGAPNKGKLLKDNEKRHLFKP